MLCARCSYLQIERAREIKSSIRLSKAVTILTFIPAVDLVLVHHWMKKLILAGLAGQVG